MTTHEAARDCCKHCEHAPDYEHDTPCIGGCNDGDLVPGWHDSPEGQADAADQARWDRQETRTNG